MKQVTHALFSENPKDTEAIAAHIGKQLKGGETIELISDLGGGKTTFVRGLARGLGSADKVASPTFTISKVYKAGRLQLYHFDFYRLDEAGLMAHELAEVADDPQAVVVVEWGDVVRDVLPFKRLQVRLHRTGEDTRQIVFTYPKELAYAVQEVQS